MYSIIRLIDRHPASCKDSMIRKQITNNEVMLKTILRSSCLNRRIKALEMHFYKVTLSSKVNNISQSLARRTILCNAYFRISGNLMPVFVNVYHDCYLTLYQYVNVFTWKSKNEKGPLWLGRHNGCHCLYVSFNYLCLCEDFLEYFNGRQVNEDVFYFNPTPVSKCSIIFR